MMAAQTANGSRGGGAAQPHRRTGRLTPVSVTIAAVTLIALGLRAFLLFRPGLEAVTQYDDGPYFGSAVRLVHGVLPYRAFAFVQPPGITLLMSPAAALSYLTGTTWALIAGRILTVLAGAGATLLAGLLVRHRGPTAAGVGGGILAIYPPAAASAHTVLLEPWLVLACLAGSVVVFDRDRLTDGSRLIWGGVVFGFAGAIKAWAIVPVVVIALLCLRDPRRALRFVAGAAAGFVLPVLPFFAAAPRTFYDSVVVAQLARIGYRISPWSRLHDMSGLLPSVSWPHAVLLWVLVGVLAVAVGGQAVASLLARRPPAALDWFALVSAVGVVLLFLWPPYFTAHYAAFLGPFLALALALGLSRLAGCVRSPAGHPAAGQSAAGRWLARSVAVVIGAGLVTAAVYQALPGPGSRFPPAPPSVIRQVIPAGACVLTDQASYLLVANRFLASAPGCPQLVDSLGTDLALSGGRRPSTGAATVPAVRAAWRAAFRSARYVLLTTRNQLRIPWTEGLEAYFQRTFLPVLWTRNFVIYARIGVHRR
jgi:hypothetical protein